MDLTSLVAERQPLPNESNFNHNTVTSNETSAPSEEINGRQLQSVSISPPSLDSQIHRLIEVNLAAAAANEPGTVVNDDGETTSFGSHTPSVGSHMVVGIDGSVPSQTQREHTASLSSATSNFSDLSLDGGYESSESTRPHLTVIGSKPKQYGYEESTTDGLNKQAVSTSDAQYGWNFKDIPIFNGEKSAIPGFLSYKEPAVEISEIPRGVLKAPKSEISDLGDRGYYANLNATGRRTAASLPPHDDQEYLDLQDKFFDALVRPYEEKKGFFPRALLSTLVTQDCVFKELNRTLSDTQNPSQIQAYAKSICEEVPLPSEEDDNQPPKIKSFKKIFAILVLIEKTPSISKFLEEGVNDLNLPLVKRGKGRNGARFDLRLSDSPDEALECFRNWTQHKIGSFEEWQWSAISPFFHKGACKDVQHFPLQDSVMLPFTRDSRRDKNARSEIEGGYGRVFEVDIHPDHHNFDLSKFRNQCFAIKRLHSPNKNDFKQEVEILKMFSDDAHPHLISLLATYEQFSVYYLIFPCADCDLYRFWSVLNCKPIFDMKTVRWVARQCEGIASGLLKIHKYQTSNANSENGSHENRFGRHGDLKPENILWFSDIDGGILKISDFGLSEYSTIHSKSYKPKSKIATSMSYRPPECDLKGGKVGQSYDIWTLGCLYLEFIAWLLGGLALVKDFERKRMSFDPMWYDMNTDTFFELVECNNSRRPGAIAAMVKPAVTNFMQQLHAHPSCTEFLHEFINMVRMDMLLVKPNNPKERGRLSSEEIHHALATMLGRCEDPDFLCKPAPWSITRQISNEVVEIDAMDLGAEHLHRKKLRHYEGPVQERPHLDMLAVPGRRSSDCH